MIAENPAPSLGHHRRNQKPSNFTLDNVSCGEWQFHISVTAITWAGRIGVLLLPPAAYAITYRICLGLQQHDRQVLAHGVETGIIRRLPDGGYAEIHQPLAAAPPRYTGWAIPKKMNRLGALPPPGKGFFKPVEPPAQPPVSRGLPPRAV